MKVSLEEFIKNGKFGTIELGMTKTQVIEQLGEKYAYGDFDSVEIIHYHWFEFFFGRNRVFYLPFKTIVFVTVGLNQNILNLYLIFGLCNLTKTSHTVS